MVPMWSKSRPHVEAFVAGNDYRAGRKTVQVLVSLALHGQVRAGAVRAGVTQQEWLLEAIREKVSRDAGGAGSGVGRSAASDRSGPRPVPGGGGEGDAGVGAGGVAVPVGRDWMDDLLESIERHPAAAPQAAPRLRVVGSDGWEPA
jgi:hypothetical protein